MREKLSALQDSELHADELHETLRTLRNDPELLGVWQRYHVIGSVLRNEWSAHYPGLTERIIEKVAKDNTQGGRAGFSISWRPALAMAASLVAVTIVAVYSMTLGPKLSGQGLLAGTDKATKWEVGRENEEALNTFLVEHGEFTPASGMNGLTAYAKFVSYDVGRE